MLVRSPPRPTMYAPPCVAATSPTLQHQQPDSGGGDPQRAPPAAAVTRTAARPLARNNAKLKVLVRSHAMREETSPPREPSPPPPCISITTSPPASPAHSPVSAGVSVQHLQDNSAAAGSATVRTQELLGSFACRRLNGSPEISVSDADPGVAFGKTTGGDPVSKDTNNSSPSLTSTNQKTCVKIIDNNFREQINYTCDCYNQICTKCSKNNERNINNNLRDNVNNNNNVIAGGAAGVPSPNTLQVQMGRAGTRHKLRQQSSSQGSLEGSASTSPCLSRDSSTEQYTDCTGIDLHQFIVDTLNKNAKDRVMMLKIEQELVMLAKDKTKTHYKFPAMSSYQRMLVHRCAAYFGMDHNIETSGKCVIVNKTKSTRIPDVRFREHVRDELLFPEEPRRSILKRDSNSFEDCHYKSPDRQLCLENRRSKSFEEREEEYEKARRRIFKDGTLQDCDAQEEYLWSEVPWPEADASKIRLLPPDQPLLKNRLLKVQSVDGRSELPRPCVAKSYSFGGYGGGGSGLSRGDSVTSTHSAGPRLLTKQDSSTSTISWRLSPSSSGYKSQSQRSDSVTPSPTATPHQLSDTSGKSSLEESVSVAVSTEDDADKHPAEKQVLWAITDMGSVPKGSVLINPQTGQPFMNEDGSIYHFDPSNPPPGFASQTKPPPSPVKLISPRKSPAKDYSHSPKRTKAKGSPARSRASLINSATSPSLPQTPPISAVHVQQTTPAQVTGVSYQQSHAHQGPAHLENASNMPIQPYPIYANGYVGGVAPSEPVYQPSVGMMYAPYTLPQQYDNRPDSAVTDLSGYFLNMSISDPLQNSCSSQSVGYQTTNTYWNQQPITYYPTSSSQPMAAGQRYPVPLSVGAQLQGAYVPTYPPSYVSVPPTPPAVAPGSAPVPSGDLVPVYNAPVHMVYQPPPTTPQQSAGVFVQAPSTAVYTQNPVYSYPPPPYPPSTPTPNSTGGTGFAQCYTYENRALRGPSHKTGGNKAGYQRGTTPNASYNQSQHSSNHSSGGSSSPANTIINGYFPNAGYRQCTPPETPPSQGVAGFVYPPNYMHQSMIFRPMSSIRASPPVTVNIRASRSPTPVPEYAGVERGQRYPAPPPAQALYGMSVPCIVPGDVRLMAGRSQPGPMYKQPIQAYRQPVMAQPQPEQMQRSHKPRKARGKVSALPPTGKHSSQSVSTHTRF